MIKFLMEPLEILRFIYIYYLDITSSTCAFRFKKLFVCVFKMSNLFPLKRALADDNDRIAHSYYRG